MYEKLHFDETYRKKIRELIHSGAFRIGDSGKLEPFDPKGAIEHPWVFTNYDARRKYCNWWNYIYCGHFNLIPTFCRFNCWKTVVYPNNVYELFQLAETFRSMNLPSKCGADRRNYTYRAWGGYIYGDTLEEGRYYYSRIRKAVDALIGPHVDIILKRGCTEMERLRPSDTWDTHTDEEKQLELQLDDLFKFTEFDFRQSAWLVNDIKENWILRAIEIRDPSVQRTLAEFCNDPDAWQRLTVTSITYHEEVDKNGKHDKINRNAAANKRSGR